MVHKFSDDGPVELDFGIMCLTDFKRKMHAEEAIGREKTHLCGNRFNMVEMEIDAFPEMPEKCVEGNSNEWYAVLSTNSSIFTENQYPIEYFYRHVYNHVKKCAGLEKCVGSVYHDDYDGTDVESSDEDSDTLKLTDEEDSDDWIVVISIYVRNRKTVTHKSTTKRKKRVSDIILCNVPNCGKSNALSLFIPNREK